MKVILSQEDGTAFIGAIHDAMRDANRVFKGRSAECPWFPLFAHIEAIGESYRRHKFGFVTFDANPSKLYDIKTSLIRQGYINSTRRRSMIMRVDESLSLYYKANPPGLV